MCPFGGSGKPNRSAGAGSGPPVGGSTAPCPHGGACSPAEAQRLFDQLKGLPNVPFDYPDDCCYSRAHEMDRVLQAQGVKPGKVWNYGSAFPDGASLRATTPNHPNGEVNWTYHVAPTVPVRGDDGVVRDMVMDPSLFDHPVTQQEWVAAQNDPKSVTQTTGPDPYFRTADDGYVARDDDYSKTNDMLAHHRAALAQRRSKGP